MKDKEARVVINLLTNRIEQLSREIQLLQKPHPKECVCKDCEGWVPDFFVVDLTTSHGGKYAPWWTRKRE